jgi:hypothetical protein
VRERAARRRFTLLPNVLLAAPRTRAGWQEQSFPGALYSSLFLLASATWSLDASKIRLCKSQDQLENRNILLA